MPGRYRCVVGGCSNENDPERNTSPHNIPCYGDDRTEAKERRKQWVDFVKLKRAKWEPNAASILEYAQSTSVIQRISRHRFQFLVSRDVGN